MKLRKSTLQYFQKQVSWKCVKLLESLSTQFQAFLDEKRLVWVPKFWKLSPRKGFWKFLALRIEFEWRIQAEKIQSNPNQVQAIEQGYFCKSFLYQNL